MRREGVGRLTSDVSEEEVEKNDTELNATLILGGMMSDVLNMATDVV